MIQSILKPFAKPEPEKPAYPTSYPFLWIDRWSTVWLRTCAACARRSRDVCLKRGEGKGARFDIGDITLTVTNDVSAWSCRARPEHVVELSNNL